MLPKFLLQSFKSGVNSVRQFIISGLIYQYGPIHLRCYPYQIWVKGMFCCINLRLKVLHNRNV